MFHVALRYGRGCQQHFTVNGDTLERCGVRLFDGLLSWPGDEAWPVNAETCAIFRVRTVAPHLTLLDEICGTEKHEALRVLRRAITG